MLHPVMYVQMVGTVTVFWEMQRSVLLVISVLKEQGLTGNLVQGEHTAMLKDYMSYLNAFLVLLENIVMGSTSQLSQVLLVVIVVNSMSRVWYACAMYVALPFDGNFNCLMR